MPINSQHPEYIKMAPVWQKMRDVVGGQRSVHARGEVYLPRLEDEKDKKYLARLLRSSFFNATWRTIDGLRGMVFRVAPTTEIAPAVEPYLKDVTKSGVPLESFVSKVTEEALTVGRVGILTDYPSANTEGLTVAQAEMLNLRPQLAMYTAESIINWDTEYLNNRHELVLVVLAESATVPGLDRFDRKTEDRWRVLELVPGADGEYAYQISVWRKGGNGGYELVADPTIPKMNGKPLTRIPFQIIGVDDLTPPVDQPPLSDLADVNLSHYRSTSDRKHGAHLTALPQPWANNIKPTFGPDGAAVAQVMTMGGGDLWTFHGDTMVGMLEYTGQGLSTLKEEIEREEAQMAVLGARMLEQQKKAVEAAETAGIHRAGEQSSLAAMAGVISQGVQNSLQVFQEWGGGGETEVKFELNKDYFPAQLTPQAITALVAAWQQGALSKEELFENLQGGGVVREGTTFEEHEAQIAESQPTLLGQSGTTPPGAGGA